MSTSLHEASENEQGCIIDDNTYYHPNPSLNGWTIQACWPPEPKLEPLVGKQITSTRSTPCPARREHKRTLSSIELNDAVQQQQQPPAKKPRSQQTHRISPGEPSHSYSHAQESFSNENQPPPRQHHQQQQQQQQQQQNHTNTAQGRGSTPAYANNQRHNPISAQDTSNQSQTPKSRRVLPQKGTPIQEVREKLRYPPASQAPPALFSKQRKPESSQKQSTADTTKPTSTTANATAKTTTATATATAKTTITTTKTTTATATATAKSTTATATTSAKTTIAKTTTTYTNSNTTNTAKPSRIHRPAAPAASERKARFEYDPKLLGMLSKEQRAVHDIIVDDEESIFFTGSAGTGKSVLLRAIVNTLKRKIGPSKVAVTASTGIAACNIGGVTLHSALAIGTGHREAVDYIRAIQSDTTRNRKINEMQVLIIDEISMVACELFDKLDEILRNIRKNERPFGGIQLVLCGDFYQLPPINKRHSENADMRSYTFLAKCWNRAVQRHVELKTIFRQRDEHFVRMLNEIRTGRVSTPTERTLKRRTDPLSIGNHILATELYPHREQCNAANDGKLKVLSGESQIYRSFDTGNEALYRTCLAPETLELKIDAQVLLIRNLSESLVNGSRGVVSRFEEERGTMYPVVKFSNSEEMRITNYHFTFESQGVVTAERTQLPLILAWAISIHKSQGQSIEYLKVDVGKCFDYGQAYVALSRATSIANLQVLNFSTNVVKSHPQVAKFYQQMSGTDK